MDDFLTKELTVNNNIVTFRQLSRKFGVHVNAAKNELARYHAHASSGSSSSSPAKCIHATYLITGHVQQARGMDVDGDDAEDGDHDEDEDAMIQMKLILVGEEHLEATKSQFTQISSIHVYALSPAPLHDAGLICASTPFVRQVDATEENSHAQVVGKVVGAHVQIKPGKLPKAAASTSLSVKLAPKNKDSDEQKEKPKPTEKPKVTGKLDWSNAKTKEMKKEEKEAKQKQAKEKKEKQKEKEKEKKKEKEKEEEEEKPKPPPPVNKYRGTKRKSTGALISDSDSDSESDLYSKLPAPKSKAAKSSLKTASPNTAEAPRTHKSAIISSSEDEDGPDVHKRKRLQKGKSRPSAHIKTKEHEDEEETEQEGSKVRDAEVERSLRAMMDDDDEVIRVPRAPALSAPSVPPSGSDAEDEDVHMASNDDNDNNNAESREAEEDIEPKPKRKRKAKKVIPVGRNGLKKRRIEKTKTGFDEKGYMVTEDYSSYESVSDEEREKAGTSAKAKAKGKGKPLSKDKEMKQDDSKSGHLSKADKDGGESPANTKSLGSFSKGKSANGVGKGVPAKSKPLGRSASSNGKGGIQNFFTKK